MRKDRRGIEGLPLRLMLVAILISLTVPTMLSLLQDTTSSIAGDKAAMMAEEIARTIEEMSAAGPGNVRTVTVLADLPAGIAFLIGGENGTIDSTRITWSIDGRENTRYLAGAAVITEDGRPLTVSAGGSIRLECPLGTWGTVRAARA